jgi:hypothetical protein
MTERDPALETMERTAFPDEHTGGRRCVNCGAAVHYEPVDVSDLDLPYRWSRESVHTQSGSAYCAVEEITA